jgi:hypothetical protein
LDNGRLYLVAQDVILERKTKLINIYNNDESADLIK